ncbi:MAG: PEP-CTERM sorting domain-containing protein [Cyanobacteria bacterium P01_D01_bin.1]
MKVANPLTNAFSKAVFLGAALLSAALVVASPAQAQTLKGSVDLSGSTRVGRPNGAAPSGTPIKFGGAIDTSATGEFSGIMSGQTPKLSKIKLTRDASGTYSTPAIESFINFGKVDFGGEMGKLTFDLDASTFDRVLPSESLKLVSNGFTGVFKFNGNTVGDGFGSFSASRVGGTEFDYDLNVGAPVPEPLTILGTMAAAGLLGVGKRELDKSGAEKSDDVA